MTRKICICKRCKRKREHHAHGLCRSCYQSTNKNHREYVKKYSKFRNESKRIGNMDNIENLCLKHGFSEDVAEAIAMNGNILDKKMKERGIVQLTIYNVVYFSRMKDKSTVVPKSQQEVKDIKNTVVTEGFKDND